jgi:TonB family protein
MRRGPGGHGHACHRCPWLRVALIVAATWFYGAAPALAEVAPPAGQWRPHRLTRCQEHRPAAGAAGDFLTEAHELFVHRNGGDAAVVLELGLREVGSQPWLLLLLAQIYLLAAEGEAHCRPLAGPAALTGDPERDRTRLLERADLLLRHLQEIWPDDALVDFLRADVARAGSDQDAAAVLDHRGRQKCTHIESLDLLRDLRDLPQQPPRVLAGVTPVYPQAAIRRNVQGEVVFDLLIDPQGRIATLELVGRADPDLAQAAREALNEASYQAGQVGPYPVWSWLRVPVRFRLGN